MAQAAAQLVSLERDIITSAAEVLRHRCPAVHLEMRPALACHKQLSAATGICVGVHNCSRWHLHWVTLPAEPHCQHVNNARPPCPCSWTRRRRR
jgi:hypothetical protein